MEEAHGGYIQNYQHGGLASASGFAGPPRGGVPPQMRGAMPRRGGIPPQMQGKPTPPWRGAPPSRAMPGGGGGIRGMMNQIRGQRGDPRSMPPQGGGGRSGLMGRLRSQMPPGKGPGRTMPPQMPPGGGGRSGLLNRFRQQQQRMQKPTGYDPRGGPIAPPPGQGGGGPPGGPMVPPNLRGHMQRQRMMNRPRRGMPGPAGAGGAPQNRVGMSDQQGGLARALQKGTGRPPMSRRSSSFR